MTQPTSICPGGRGHGGERVNVSHWRSTRRLRIKGRPPHREEPTVEDGLAELAEKIREGVHGTEA